MSWLFLVASIALLIYTYYRSEIAFLGLREGYFKYYLIALTGILFWGVVLRLREEIQANIVTVACFLVVGLYLVEGTLTVFRLGVPPQLSQLAAKQGVEYDERTKLEVIDDLIAEGVDAVPTAQGWSFIRIIGTNKEDIGHLFPLGGVSNKTAVHHNETGLWAIYLNDRHGFNNPDSEWDATKLEWLLIGDSFTEGVAVQPGEDIAGQLRAITHQSAINLGRGGNGPLTELAALTEYAGAIKPKKVLWIYYEGNDLISKRSNQINDLQRDKMNPLLMRYMEEGFSQNLINRQKEINSRLEKYIAIAQVQAKTQAQKHKIRWMRLYTIRSVIGLDDYVDIDVDVDVDYPLFAKILTKAKAGVESRGSKLYFVYLPEIGRYNKVVSHDKFRKKSEVIDLVKGLDIPVIDIHQEVFANNPDPLSLFPLREFGHYNAEGYSEVAKAIVENIRD
ncbi:uncharacterized protein METZ01_LOCUS130686 [marine metagenome]|uniref:SGNH hydrolase-type esterase domain-containing protein n=1 Tax=marine metagenome TaxID=408172 RepID=A0A381YMK1_9ZZZZ